MTQECLHTINTKKLNALILKMDLVKAHDMVNWVFLRLVLLRIGLPLEVTDSIMACATATCFVVLVNGSSTIFSNVLEDLVRGAHYLL